MMTMMKTMMLTSRSNISYVNEADSNEGNIDDDIDNETLHNNTNDDNNDGNDD